MAVLEVEKSAEGLAAELAEVRGLDAALDREYKEAKRELRARATRVQRDLDRARAREARGPRRELSARAQAGPKNIEKMLTAFKSLGGRASAAAATAEAGSPPGHQVWAIRALTEDGLLRDTGENEGRSRVYALTAEGKTEARRVTRRRPGS